MDKGREEVLLWFGKMMGCLASLPVHERAALDEWEGGPSFSKTSDWPGWERYIGKFPQGPDRPSQVKKEFVPVAIRWEVWSRDNFTCKQCGVRKNLTVDHILAESKGGTLALDNLQTLCHLCNSAKGSR